MTCEGGEGGMSSNMGAVGWVWASATMVTTPEDERGGRA